MFSLLSGFYTWLTSVEEFHVLLLGLDRAGKTNVLERLKTLYSPQLGLDPGKILPTVGLNVGRLSARGKKLVVWDLGGQPSLRSIWDKYYHDCHAVVYVVDSEARGRWEEARGVLEKVLLSTSLGSAPVLVFANKQDLENAASHDEVASALGIASFASVNRPINIVPVCAYTGQGLKEGVEWLVAAMKKSHRGFSS